MIIFTAVWGEHYFNCLENGLIKSLSFPKNAQSVKDDKWVIATTPDNVERCKAILGTRKVDFDLAIKDDTSFGFLKRSLVNTIEKCLDEREPFLMALPDAVFAEGTIENLKKVGEEQATCVCFAHFRVNPSFLPAMGDEILTSPKMVSLGYKHAHGTWVHAESGKEYSNSYHGGMHWKRLSDKIVSVQHRLPTASYVNFIPRDLKYFQDEDRYDGWDHRWPATWNQRMRYIGSSDAAFMVEVTEVNRNNARLAPVFEHRHPDSYREDRDHHKINRQVSVIFREE